LRHFKITEKSFTMGKGDRRSRKGKRWRKSYGKARPKSGKSKREHRQAKKQEQEQG